MAGNYSPFEDDYYLDADCLDEVENAARLEVVAERLLERDARRVWRTAEGRDIALSRLGKLHLIHICGFLLGMGLDPKEVTPNLAEVAELRWAPERHAG